MVRKRVFTLSFDRSSEMRWATVDKLQSAARNRGVVLCTAATIKSLQLKMLEKMDVLRDVRRKHHPTMERDVRAIAHVLKLFRSGCLIMDEGNARRPHHHDPCPPPPASMFYLAAFGQRETLQPGTTFACC